MDRVRFTTIAHRHHIFCSPLGPLQIEAALSSLGLAPDAQVLDVGCGKGELLIRAIEGSAAYGLGLDTNPDFLEQARQRAAGRDAGNRLEFRLEDAALFALEPASFDAVFCVASTHAYGGFPKTLRTLRPALRPGGRMLIGEGFWKREPDPAYLEVLGGTREEFRTHQGNLELALAEGLAPGGVGPAPSPTGTPTRTSTPTQSSGSSRNITTTPTPRRCWRASAGGATAT